MPETWPLLRCADLEGHAGSSTHDAPAARGCRVRQDSSGHACSAGSCWFWLARRPHGSHWGDIHIHTLARMHARTASAHQMLWQWLTRSLPVELFASTFARKFVSGSNSGVSVCMTVNPSMSLPICLYGCLSVWLSLSLSLSVWLSFLNSDVGCDGCLTV